jgi:hypothetical protein
VLSKYLERYIVGLVSVCFFFPCFGKDFKVFSLQFKWFSISNSFYSDFWCFGAEIGCGKVNGFGNNSVHTCRPLCIVDGSGYCQLPHINLGL